MVAPYACVIVNPASANGATGRHWPEMRAALDRVLDRWDNHFTLGPHDATRLARQAVQDGYEMIVSVGGDGTTSEVVSGLFAPDPEQGVGVELLRKDVIIGVVRQGTGGDLARFLGLSGRLPNAVAHLGGENARPADVGLVEFRDHEGRPRRSAFLNIASFGLSGVVDEKVNATSKALGGRLSFMVGLGRALASYRPQPVRVRVDGEPVYEGRIVVGAVANGQYFGGGMRMAPRARIDDGRFDVVLQLRSGLREAIAVRDLYTGRVAEWACVRYLHGQSVVAEPVDSARVLLDIDGEPLGVLPATFRLIPGGIRLKA